MTHGLLAHGEAIAAKHARAQGVSTAEQRRGLDWCAESSGRWRRRCANTGIDDHGTRLATGATPRRCAHTPCCATAASHAGWQVTAAATTKNPHCWWQCGSCVAEREGFEPSMRLYTPYSLSRGAPSATRSSLRSSLLCLKPWLFFGWGLRKASLSQSVRRLVQIELAVQRTHSQLHVLLVDHHRGLDF